MANASSSCISGIFQLTVDDTDLAKNSIESSEIRLSDVNWKIKLEKRIIDGNKEYLGVYLVSTFVDGAANLSCEAQATFKLLRNNGQIAESIVKYLQSQTFNNANPSHGFDDYIDWNDFNAGFVSAQGKTILKIELSTQPVYRTIALDIQQEYAKLHVVVEQVNEIQCCQSPEIIVRGIKWKVMIKKNDDDLAIFLWADKMDMDKNWIYKADCTFHLLAHDKADAGIKKFTKATFHYDSDDWGYLHFVKWSDFTGPRFTIGDKANFIVEFNVH